MSSLFFWKSWNPAYRFTYLFSLAAFLISLILFVVAWARGLGNVVNWDILSELNELPVTFNTFSDGLFNYAVNGKAYAVSEQFVAGSMQIHPDVATAFLVGICFAFVLLLSAVTRFDRLRYLISMVVLILGLVFFRWDMLDVPGLGGSYVFLLLTFAIGSVSYYFHAFRPDFPISIRLMAFGSLTTLVFIVFSVLSPVAFPAMAIVSYGMPVLLVLSTGFIFFIAPEIIAGLVWLTSAGRSQATGLGGGRQVLGVRNFLFVSFLYVVNLVLIWLKNTKIVDWDVLAISPFLLYMLSVGVGIWGFRRLVDQQSVVSFRDSGAFLYAGFAVLTTLTIGYAFATANDPLVELFEDVIVYTHLCMGVFFAAYVLINFWPIYQQNLPVHRVLYKPKRLELVLFRVVGLFGTVALLSSGQFFTVRQGVAGYFNGLGDYHAAAKDPVLANAYYQLALEREFQNHKSNYALASLARLQNKPSAAAFYFQQALLKQPNPEDYAGLSQTYLQTNLFFEAVKALQRGIRAFPKSGELQNNLGYLYARTSVADSAYYYLKSAANHAHRKEVPESNLLAFYARNPAVIQADSTVIQHLDASSSYEPYQANALVLKLVANADTSSIKRPAWLASYATDKPLSVGQFAHLYNHTLVSKQPDSTLAITLKSVSENPVNQDVTDDLLLARAVAEYNQHNHPTAFGLMSQLAEGTPKDAAMYWSITGLWMLEQGLYPKAAEIFGNNEDTTSIFYRAIAFTKAYDPILAQSGWETVAKTDPSLNALKQVYYQERSPQTDLEKAFYITYRIDDLNRGNFLQTIDDPNLKTVSGVALINTLLEQSEGQRAQQMLAMLPATLPGNSVAQSVRSVVALRLAAFQRNVTAAQTLANQSVLLRYRAEQHYWLGQTYERTRQLDKARQQYEQAIQLAPLNARVVATAAQLAQKQNRTKAGYDQVLTALPFNENNPYLLKTYITLCLALSLPDYAETGLARLRISTTPADYQAFLTTYQEKVASIEKSKEKFLQ